MKNTRTSITFARAIALLGLLTGALACTHSSTGTHTLPPSTGAVTLALSAGYTEDWRSIEVKVMGVTLTPQGDGPPVTLFAAPNQGVAVNLAQLDQVSQILGAFAAPVGTYTAATLILDADSTELKTPVRLFPYDLHAPEFPGFNTKNAWNHTYLMKVPASSKVLALTVPLTPPLVVSTDLSGVLDLDFDLAQPSFLVPSVPPTESALDVIWAVDFDHVLRHRPIREVTHLVLQQLQGYVESVATDNTAFAFKQVINGDSTMPQPLRVRVDAGRGTRVYDMPTQTEKIVQDFSSIAGSLVGTPVRIAARLQPDGSLVAVRIWAGKPAGLVSGWEIDGHIQAVDLTANTISMEGAAPGMLTGANLQVDANTTFFLRNPGDPAADATPIGTGIEFFRRANFWRGMKVHTTSRWSNTAPYWTLLTMDIEAPHVDGFLSNGLPTQFTVTRPNATGPATTLTLPFVAETTLDDSASPQANVAGFKWWNLANPSTFINAGANAIPTFLASLGAGVDFGGSVGLLMPWRSSHVRWGEGTPAGGWRVQWTENQALRVPPGTVATPWLPSTQGGSFGMTVAGASQPVIVEVSSLAGSATLFYELSLPVHWVSQWGPIDLPIAASTLSYRLAVGSTVRVFGVPLPNGHIQAQAISHVSISY